MKTVICPSCASVIELDQDMPFGYCKVCGDKVSYADASTLKLSRELLECTERLQALKPEVLFTIAKYTQEAYSDDLMKLASEKGYLPANLHLGIKYYFADRLDDGKKYLTAASKDGSVDAEALLIVVQYRETGATEEEELLSKLKLVCKKPFEDKRVYQHCERYIGVIQKDIQQKKFRADSYPDTPYIPVNPTNTANDCDCGPTGMAKNCGMPPIDVSDL